MEKGYIDVKDVMEKYRRERSNLIPILQEVQSKYGYVPGKAVEFIAKELNIYPIEIYEILTFYSQFRLTPRGKHVIRVCLGTACHVMGGQDIFDYLSGKLGISAGETTKDGLFTLERVACLGCCGMAPVLVMDDNIYGRQTIQSVDRLLNRYIDGGKGDEG